MAPFCENEGLGRTNEDVATYAYNGDGQRVSKTVGGVTTTYVWDGDYIIYQTDGTNEQKYLRGANLYGMIDSSGDTYYYGYNTHGDVVELRDEDGVTVRQYYYDAFGNQLNTNTNDTNPFRYCAEFYDDETDYIYLR